MPDYQSSRIYCLRAPGTDMVYIGSTTQTLSRRFSAHESDYKLFQQGKKQYLSSFKLLEIPGHYIELLEEFPCYNKEQLNKREGELIRAHASCVNKQVAGRSRGEYQQDNKDAINEYRRKRFAENREAMCAYHREWRLKKKLQQK